MITCPNCQHENREGAKFCDNCGRPLNITCSVCGAVNRATARFCDNCGNQLGGAAPSAKPVPDEERAESRQSQDPNPPEQTVPSNSQGHTPGDQSLPPIVQDPHNQGPSDERRIVTILFCDVKGSTEAASHLDPEEWAEIINGAFERMIRPVYHYEGFVARLMGDSILAFFGAPVAHEDDPQRAILAGLDIFNEIGDYKNQVYDRWRVEFDLRVGINTGLVMVGQVGSDLQMEYTALGDAINLAARMEQTARPGTVQVSQETYSLVAPLFEWEDLGESVIKGKDQPVHSYRPLRPKARPGRLRGLESYEIQSPMVGRDAEFTFLQSRFQRLLEGQGAFILIIGEAGMGKSRLITELHRLAGDLPPGSLMRASGSTLSYRQSSSYYPWREALQNLISSHAAVSEASISVDPEDAASQRIGLAAVCSCCALPGGDLPFLETLLGIEDEAARQVIHGFQGEALVRRMTEATRGFLCGLAAEAPVVLVLDDLHWADQASLDLLLNVADLTRQHRLLIIGVMRPDRQAESWGFRRSVQDKLGADYSEISLRPLPVETSRQLLSNLLNEDHLPGELRTRILSKVEGNPFFMEEVVRSLIQTGALVRRIDPQTSRAAWDSESQADAVEIPENLQTLLVARIDRLEKEARRTLQLASVIGRSFYYRILAAVHAAIAARQAAAVRAGLEGDLSALEQAELIMAAGSLPEPGYIFRHALTQEAAYRTILLKQRRQFHRQVGEAIESLFEGRLEEFFPVLAHHFSEAQDSRALRYAELAAEAAFRLYAVPEAVEFYRQALELARHSRQSAADNDQPAASDTLLRLYLRLGRCYELQNDYPQALELYDEMESQARIWQDRQLEMEALIAKALVNGLPLSLSDHRLAVELCDRADLLAEKLKDGAAQAKINWIRLMNHMYSGRMDLGLPFGEKSVQISRTLGLREQLASSLQDLSLAYMASGQLERAHAVLDEARSLWEALDNQPMLAENRTDHAMERLLSGNFSDALILSDQAYTISERIRNDWGMVNSRVFVSIAYTALGETDRALANLDWVIPMAIKVGHPGVAMSLVQQAHLYAKMGRIDLAFAAAGRVEELPIPIEGFQIYGRVTAGWLHLQAGNPALAASLIAEGARLERNRSIYEIDLRIILFRLELALAQGDLEGAAALVDEIESSILASGARLYLPELCLLAARLSELQQKQPAALAWLERGAAAAREIDYRIAEFDLEMDLIRLLNRIGQGKEAANHQRRAGELANFILAHISDPELRDSFQSNRMGEILLSGGFG